MFKILWFMKEIAPRCIDRAHIIKKEDLIIGYYVAISDKFIGLNDL